MKLTKWELALVSLAAAAAVFTAGYFAGRGGAGDVSVTVAPPPADTGKAGTAGLVDLNTATRWELMSLPGVGETLADRIVEYRTVNGPFGTVGELLSVQGIGESLFNAISGLVTV